MAGINPVLLLMHNNVKMTRDCIESLRAQDIPVMIYVIDNATTEDVQWVQENVDNYDRFEPQLGVSAGWNTGLEIWFADKTQYVLVPNTDTILPSWFYSTLLSYDAPLVTGVSVGTIAEISEPPSRKELAPCPDFSAFLIRRECWEKVGPFDESMVHYCGDLDYHVRGCQLGVPMMNTGVPFYHERSSTLRLANPLARRIIELQADADRAAFRRKWGVGSGEVGFAKLFEPKG